MALAGTAFSRPSEEPRASDPLEEVILKHPKTAVVAALLTGTAIGVTPHFYRGIRQAFTSRRRSRSSSAQCDVPNTTPTGPSEYPYPPPAVMPPNNYPEDAIAITVMDLFQWYERGWGLPYRPELTPRQEALRQGFFQGIKDAGAVTGSDEIAKLLDGFEEGYQAKVDGQDHVAGNKKGYERARIYRDRPGLGDAYQRGYNKGYKRALYADQEAKKLQKDVNRVYQAGLALGLCFWESYDLVHFSPHASRHGRFVLIKL